MSVSSGEKTLGVFWRPINAALRFYFRWEVLIERIVCV